MHNFFTFFDPVSMPKSLMSPITILMIVIVAAAAATWLIPAGKYDTLEYTDNAFVIHSSRGDSTIPYNARVPDGLGIKIAAEKFSSGSIRKPVAIPGTYHALQGNRQGIIEIIQAPLRGIMDSIDIILFILVIGGFINVFNETGAMAQGLRSLSAKFKGRESWLIIVLTFLFSFGGASFGMAEEGFAFYAILIPLFRAAGYDMLIPVAVIFGGTQLGTLASFTNPFSTIIASNAAGVNWTDGLTGRIFIFIVTTSIYIWYIVRYALRVKKDPARSLAENTGEAIVAQASGQQPADEIISRRKSVLLIIFLLTFLIMIAGVVWLDWWLLEMSALFLTASLVVAIISRLGEKLYLKQFITGAEGLLSVAFIVGIARGITFVMNEGNISDTILYYSANVVKQMPPSIFIIALLGLFMVFNQFIASSSGMAVLTMPIMGALAVIINIPGREIVNAYLYGMGIMGFLTPTGLILPSLALCNVGFKAWWKFILPLLVILFVVCSIFLVAGIYLG